MRNLPISSDPYVQTILWSLATIAFYLIARRLYKKWLCWWLTPVVVAPALLAATVLIFHESYRDYSRGAGWLVALLGPATVAFAAPVYEQRALIRRHWPLLLAGTAAGSLTAIASSWALAMLLDVDGALRLSLLPRSISTPFAMEVSSRIGGAPDLTAVFVIITGVVGAAIGDLALALLPLRSRLARGALFGLGAHGVGTARAYQIGQEEGTVAGLVMTLAGLTNVLAAPALAHFLG